MNIQNEQAVALDTCLPHFFYSLFATAGRHRAAGMNFAEHERRYYRQLQLDEAAQALIIDAAITAMGRGDAHLSVMSLIATKGGAHWRIEKDLKQVLERQQHLEADAKHVSQSMEPSALSALLGRRDEVYYMEMVKYILFLDSIHFAWSIVHTHGSLLRARVNVWDALMGHTHFEVDEYRLEIDFGLSLQMRKKHVLQYQQSVLYSQPAWNDVIPLTPKTPQMAPPSSPLLLSRSSSGGHHSTHAQSGVSGPRHSSGSSSSHHHPPPPPMTPNPILPRIIEEVTPLPSTRPEDENAASSTSSFEGRSSNSSNSSGETDDSSGNGEDDSDLRVLGSVITVQKIQVDDPATVVAHITKIPPVQTHPRRGKIVLPAARKSPRNGLAKSNSQ